MSLHHRGVAVAVAAHVYMLLFSCKTGVPKTRAEGTLRSSFSQLPALHVALHDEDFAHHLHDTGGSFFTHSLPPFLERQMVIDVACRPQSC